MVSYRSFLFRNILDFRQKLVYNASFRLKQMIITSKMIVKILECKTALDFTDIWQ